ncbi:MAG: AAA family ATPase [Campylobacterota bacterium]|nr:AAA family ATPase [Campylobacterota bacterium]
MRSIPYGISNFKKIREERQLYIEKTGFIREIESDSAYLIMLRPRRFGKSLLLSTLAHYYDQNKKEQFDMLFGGLDISREPTALKNSYKILLFEFSKVETESVETIRRDFDSIVRSTLNEFLKKYNYTETIAIEPAQTMMMSFFAIVKSSKIYLLIDEYDHFANSIMADDLKLFGDIVGKGGFVRSFYEALKTATFTGVVDRIFITGVTPITMDSMTSGFNIATNITNDEKYNNLLGFTREETRSTLEMIYDECDISRDALLTTVTKWYNGYKFNAQSKNRVFNPNMLLYFLLKFDYIRCENPQKMLDTNIASDYGKIMRLFTLGDADENFKILEALINNNEVTEEIVDRFDFDRDFETRDFINLLYYMGFITIKECDLSDTKFMIPNAVIKQLYFDYFKVEVEKRADMQFSSREIKESIKSMVMQNDIQPFVAEFRNVLKLLSNRDFIRMDEKHIKSIMLTMLYSVNAYFIKSEPEYEGRYPDIMLLFRSPYKLKYQFLFELKYYKKSKSQDREKKIAEGIEQIESYKNLDEIKELESLCSYIILSDGRDVEALKV